MRARTILLTTSLLLVALSLPPASADPTGDACQPTGTHAETVLGGVYVGIDENCMPDVRGPRQTAAAPGCHVEDIEQEGPSGTHRVEVAHNCHATVTLNEGVVCLGATVDRDEYDLVVGTLVVYSCGNPDQGGGIGDPVAASAQPGCPPQDQERVRGLRIQVEHNCRVHVTVGSDCPYPTTTEVLGHTVTQCLARESATTAQPGCPPRTVDRGTALGTIRFEQEHNCRVDVTVGEGVNCVGANTGTLSHEVSGNTVTVHYCRPPSVTTSGAPGCPERDFHAETFFGGLYVAVERDCSVIVNAGHLDDDAQALVGALCPDDVGGPAGFGVDFDERCQPHATGYVGNECIGGSGDRKVLYDDGYLHVSYTSCRSHLPPISATSASAAPSCEKAPRFGFAWVSEDCTTVSLRFYECVWGGYWHDHHFGPVTVREYRCGPPPTTQASQECPASSTGGLNTVAVREDCTAEVGVFDGAYCVGGGGHRVERDVAGNTVRVLVCSPIEPTVAPAAADPFPTCIREPCGPQVPTPPTAPCSKLEVSGGAGATYDVDGGCNVVVEVKFYDCVWNGKWHSRTVGPVTVRVYECSTPQVAGTSAADPFPTCIRDCSPVPRPDCTGSPLQAIGTDQPVYLRVRDDCTAEVGLFDGAICVGGWGTTTERDVAGNTVRVTVCDGGLGHRLGDLIQTTDTSAGGPCDRIQGPITSEELTWTIDDRCRHDIYVDVIECPNQSQWTKTNERYEAHPNLTLHYTFCRLG